MKQELKNELDEIVHPYRKKILDIYVWDVLKKIVPTKSIITPTTNNNIKGDFDLELKINTIMSWQKCPVCGGLGNLGRVENRCHVCCGKGIINEVSGLPPTGNNVTRDSISNWPPKDYIKSDFRDNQERFEDK